MEVNHASFLQNPDASTLRFFYLEQRLDFKWLWHYRENKCRQSHCFQIKHQALHHIIVTYYFTVKICLLTDVDCGPPSDVQNSISEQVHLSTTYGSTIHYTCIEGFQTERGIYQISRQCHSSGHWYPELSHCTGKWNISDPNPKNGATFSWFINQTVTTYDLGYRSVCSTLIMQSLWVAY